MDGGRDPIQEALPEDGKTLANVANAIRQAVKYLGAEGVSKEVQDDLREHLKVAEQQVREAKDPHARLQSARDRLATFSKRARDHRDAAEELLERANQEFQASEDAQELAAEAQLELEQAEFAVRLKEEELARAKEEQERQAVAPEEQQAGQSSESVPGCPSFFNSWRQRIPP